MKLTLLDHVALLLSQTATVALREGEEIVPAIFLCQANRLDPSFECRVERCDFRVDGQKNS